MPEYIRPRSIQGLDKGDRHSFPIEELNRYAVVFANPPSFGQDKLSPHLIQPDFYWLLFIGSNLNTISVAIPSA